MPPAVTLGHIITSDPCAYPPRGLDLASAARYLGLDPVAFSALLEAGYLNVYTPEILGERWSCIANHIRNVIKRGQLAGLMLGGRLIASRPQTWPPTRTVFGSRLHPAKRA